MRSATEGSGDNKGLSEKMDSDEKETILDVPSHIRAEETINLSELLWLCMCDGMIMVTDG